MTDLPNEVIEMILQHLLVPGDLLVPHQPSARAVALRTLARGDSGSRAAVFRWFRLGRALARRVFWSRNTFYYDSFTTSRQAARVHSHAREPGFFIRSCADRRCFRQANWSFLRAQRAPAFNFLRRVVMDFTTHRNTVVLQE